MNRPTLHRQLDPAQLARIFGDDHREREDYADAYDWLNRRKPGLFAELRANPELTLIVAGAGIGLGALLTAGVAFVWSLFL